MFDRIKQSFDILIKKMEFKLNPGLVFTRIDGKIIHRTKAPLLKICEGKGVDVGCGSNKITKNAIGIDIIGKGERGKYGCEKNKISEADIKSSGDNLTMFDNNSLDYVVARDNLEHYIDYLKTLREWNRILKKGGKLGITIPNDEEIDSLRLDPTHKHAFNPNSLKTALNLTGFKMIETGETIKGWGFYIIAEKIK